MAILRKEGGVLEGLFRLLAKYIYVLCAFKTNSKRSLAHVVAKASDKDLFTSL